MQSLGGVPGSSTAQGWTFADVWELIAADQPDAPALIHGGAQRTWAELDARASALANAFVENGAAPSDKVAQYLYNGNEYLESVYAAFKARMVPVNTNYRYVDDELVYLWDNADVVAVVFHGSFAERIDRLRVRVPRVRGWYWVDDGTGPMPEWAVPFEAAASADRTPTSATSAPRDGSDLLLLYTGGTTGMPKGVVWRQSDLYNNFSETLWRDPPEPDAEAVLGRVRARRGPIGLPACPLMHGTGLFSAMQQLCQGGAVVTLASRRFDAAEVLDAVEQHRVSILTIVGDAFGRPILSALQGQPGRWQLDSLKVVVSSGVMFSTETKAGLLDVLGRIRIVDAFSSSEAMGMAQSVSSRDVQGQTARFVVGERTRVITDDGVDVAPGSGQTGRVAVGGYQPLGYYKDRDKTASTFIEMEGRRYSMPGDYATVDAEGVLTLLGRGSLCINTAGEKVFPEEVEEVLKRIPSVVDAAVVGIPDERFGEIVVAVVESSEPESLDEELVIAYVKENLASYKAPRRLLTIDTIGRAANGKVDYRRLRAHATDVLDL